jgi:hypothetical protein
MGNQQPRGLAASRSAGARILPRAWRGEAPGRGVRDRHLGPLSCPLKAALLQGKRLGVRDSRPLGSGMDSSAFSQPQEVLPERGHGLRPPSRRRLGWGSKMADHRPSAGPSKRPICREKALFHGGNKYCHDGGMTLPHHLTTWGHSRLAPCASTSKALEIGSRFQLARSL